MSRFFLWAAGAVASGALLLAPQQRVIAQNTADERGTSSSNNDRETDSPHQTPADTTNSDQGYQERAPDGEGMRERTNNEWNDRNESRSSRRDRDWRSEIRFDEPTRDGLKISRVEQGSHYYRNGLRDGDVIISYNGRPLRNQDEFGRWANDWSGERTPVIVLRDGRRETVYIQYQDDRGDARSYANNAGQYESQAFLGVRFEPRPRGGAVISAVDPGSPAEEAGLKPGDELVSINGRRISSSREATRIVSSMQPGDKVDIEFSRRTNEHVQAVLKEHSGDVASARYQESDRGRQGNGIEQSSYDEESAIGAPDDYRSSDQTIERGSERRGGRTLFQRLRN